MKNFTTVKALALSLLCVLPAMAARHTDDHEYRDSDECCGQPIYCGGFNLEVRGGIAPQIWNNRDCFLLANCITPTTTCGNAARLTPLGGLPKFNSLYKLPYFVGARLGYGVCDRIEAGLEFDYRAASAKNGSDCNSTCDQFSLCYTSTNTVCGQTTLAFSGLSKYKAFSGYIGSRWYSDRYWCDSVAFFLGIKVGFVHHKEIDVTITPTTVVGTTSTVGTAFVATPLYFKNTTISAGGAVGFDWCFWNRLSFVFTAEFIGNGPLRANHDLGISSCDSSCSNSCPSNCDTGCGTAATCVNLATTQTATANLVGPNFNTEIVFPITFGLKYYF